MPKWTVSPFGPRQGRRTTSGRPSGIHRSRTSEPKRTGGSVCGISGSSQTKQCRRNRSGAQDFVDDILGAGATAAVASQSGPEVAGEVLLEKTLEPPVPGDTTTPPPTVTTVPFRIRVDDTLYGTPTGAPSNRVTLWETAGVRNSGTGSNRFPPLPQRCFG